MAGRGVTPQLGANPQRAAAKPVPVLLAEIGVSVCGCPTFRLRH